MKENAAQVRRMYIDLLRDIIVNEIYRDPPVQRNLLRNIAQKIAKTQRRSDVFDERKRSLGLDWPSVAHSMIGRQRMDNLRDLACEVIEKGIPGDFIETGVWRGGACILVRGIFKAYGETGRTVWVADSFEGLPKPDAAKYAADRGDRHHELKFLAISQQEVEANFAVYGLLDEQVRFLKSWFKDTLPTAPIEKLAILRLDGDMYQSTMDGLENLYGKVSPGGYIIVDDYHAVAGCRQAVHDFLGRAAPDEKVAIQEIDGTGVFWQRQI